MSGLLLVCFCFLVAGVIAVPIASHLGLGSVLGYLIAGIMLSPLLTALNVDVVSIQHIAEFGVVMMLFLVGLELEPRALWQMKNRLLGLGGLQVGLSAAGIMACAMFFGLPWTIALAVGLVLSLSSTAIVLQTLNEKGLMKSDGGQASFSVLLFQDIAVIPMLALIPLLALPELVNSVESAAHGADNHGPAFIDSLQGWQRAAVTVAAIAAVIVGGHFMTRPLFRYIALANLREIFTAAALLFVVAIALLMTLVGLSPALGTFLAGVVLANSEYRHELESDIDPFKGLLLGLFFMTVGATINFSLLSENLISIVALTLGLIVLKAAVLFLLSYIFKIQRADRFLFSLGLAQAGEFGFVLISLTVANAVIPDDIADKLLLIVALSMLLTPALFIVYEKFIVPRHVGGDAQEADTIDETGSVIIAGHGRFGGIINRVLRAYGYSTVVVDFDSEQLEILRKFGIKLYFGDATRPDLLHAAGIDQARMLVIAIDNEHHITELARYVSSHHPHVHIVARAVNRQHVFRLYAAGANDIIRDTFDSATRAARSALEALDVHPYEAQRKIDEFVKFDKFALLHVAQAYDPDIPWHENSAYLEKVNEMLSLEDQMLQGNEGVFGESSRRGWQPPGSELIDSDSLGSASAENQQQKAKD
ncbi:MAG: cation:proton antiporter [Granulosicoccus sp.]|nr:cation:proton antiporter [Granulosicoccus sp.]